MKWNPSYLIMWNSGRLTPWDLGVKQRKKKKTLNRVQPFYVSLVCADCRKWERGELRRKLGKRGRKGKKRRRGRRKRKGKEKRKGGEEEERERKREKSRGEEEKVAAFHSFSLLSPLSSIFPPIFPPKYCLYRSRIGRYDRYSQNIGCNGQYFTEIMVILTATILRPL
eukprot:TRINITY_DN9869_c0_g1_i1.p1 TRINITY_DN9869_c0_g1~~TRINITY_DN9869_c0_g1_i1.p1  ORF type:complete len:168 (-),score=20.74 TRINITY_DN9869_c0_g1_i1:534-1037(-)